jgi:Tfp pilus assembly protein PilE
MMPNPWMILGAIFVCISAYFYGHHAGYVQRDKEMQAQIALKNEQARQAETKLNEQINQTSTELKEANDAIAKKQSDLNRLINAGRVRLPTAGCVQASTSTPAAPGSVSDASESDRETLQLIAQLAAEGDQAINRLNACIAAYNQVRKTVNSQ